MGLLDKLEIPEEMRPAFEAAVRFGVDPKAVVICPECNKQKLELRTRIWTTGKKDISYRCDSCGYTAYFVLNLPQTSKDKAKNLRARLADRTVTR